MQGIPPGRDAFVDRLRGLYASCLKERENDLVRYDRYLALMQPGVTLTGLVEEMLARRPTARLLDLGCGDAGALAGVVQRFGDRVEAVGVDLVAPARPVHGVTVRVGDALDLSFPPDRDLIVSFRSLHEIGRLAVLVPKIADALAPGGRAFLSIRIAGETDGRITPEGLMGADDVTWLRGALAAGRAGRARARGEEVSGAAVLRLPAEVAGVPREMQVPYVAGVNLFLERA